MGLNDGFKVNKFSAAKGAVLDGVKAATRALAFRVKDEAQQNIRDLPAIDTSSLWNSAFVETKESSEKSQAVSAAVSAAQKPGKKSGKANPNVALAGPGTDPGEYQAVVAFAVEHAVYVEMGVKASAYGDIPARPFLSPAFDLVSQEVDEAVESFVQAKLQGVL